jgi:hypothetical protein
MMILLLFIALVLVVIAGFVSLHMVLRAPKQGSDGTNDDVMKMIASVEERLRVDLSLNRREQAESIKSVGDSLDRRMAAHAQMQRTTLEQMGKVT